MFISFMRCYWIAHTSKILLKKKKNQHNKRMKKKRFVRFFFSVVYSFAFESLWKRLIILNVSAPHFQSKHGRKSQKQTEQKEFREKWKYNIVISRVRTHSTINSMDVKRRWRKRRRKKRPKKMQSEQESGSEIESII